MTEGQRTAIRQLRRVEYVSDGSLEVVLVEPDVVLGFYTDVTIAVDCSSIPHLDGGIQLRDRERFVLRIHPEFPFRIPTVRTPHARFAGFAHVQWKRQLCLYVSPSTEWDPNDGMFGFLDRLYEWLIQAAANQLDPTGAPLHPPVVYDPVDRMVIPRTDTPTVGGEPWLGTAQLEQVSEHRVDVMGWSPLFQDKASEGVAAAILLSEAMPFEFPRDLSDLLRVLEERGVEKHRLLLTLQYAAVHNREDEPLYVLLGTPMRGIRGSADLKQHLTAWYISPVLAKALRLALNKYDANLELQRIGSEVEDIIWEWAKTAPVEWCEIQEQRPEIVTRRDADVPMSWFAGRAVAIWGCGALGSHVAEFLARAGAKKLILRDAAKVKPGILVRQRFDDADVGDPKVEALAAGLARIRPDLELDAASADVVSGELGSDDWWEDVELLIDTTASRGVVTKLEMRCHFASGLPIPIISMVIGPRAQRGLVVLALRGHSGGPRDVLRRAELELQSHPELKTYRDVFWPDPQERQAQMFQPEPGCSSPTFVGSAADVAALAGMMLNGVAADLAEPSSDETAAAHFFTQPRSQRDEEPTYSRLSWGSDSIVPDRQAGYEIRLTESAWADMFRYVEKGQRRRGRNVETGGLLLGERDDAARVIWVSEASGPPPDSSFSREQFVCGRIGTAELCRRRREETEGRIQFVGMWHTHPTGPAEPSRVDLNGMARVMSSLADGPRNPLLLIVGYAASNPELGGHVFLSDAADELPGVPIPAPRGIAMLRHGLMSVVYVGRSRVRETLSGWYNDASAFWRSLRS